jgi:hypothetical protein
MNLSPIDPFAAPHQAAPHKNIQQKQKRSFNLEAPPQTNLVKGPPPQ